LLLNPERNERPDAQRPVENAMRSDRHPFSQATGLLVIASIVFLMPIPADAIAAQPAYPDKPIRVIVGFAAGGPADFAARVIGDELSKSLGQPIVIENATGAGGNVATERVVRAAADGYTLLMATSGMIVINPMLYKNLTFDTSKDLAPISLVSTQSNILVVHNDLPAKNLQDLVALARSQPGQLTYASGGVGSTQHLAGELFRSMADIDIRHVPYRGIVLAVPDLLTGRITMAFANATAALPQVRDGTLRALAVTSLQRSPALPDLPTVAESGFVGFEATSWYGLMAPSATPVAIIERLHQETSNVLALASLRRKFDELDMQTVGSSPAAFATTIRSDIPHWAKVVQGSRMKLAE
jgi:tripartite-type tricarboxylate transporter receptor subunit TctC